MHIYLSSEVSTVNEICVCKDFFNLMAYISFNISISI